MTTSESLRTQIQDRVDRYPPRISGLLTPSKPDHGFTHIKHVGELTQNRKYVFHRGVGYATQIEINTFIPVEDPQKIAVTVFDKAKEYQIEYPLSDLGITPNEEGNYHTTNWLQDPSRIERFPLLAQLLKR